MGRGRHGSAPTPRAVRAALRRPQASRAQPSRALGSEEDQKTIQWIVVLTNPGTVATGRRRAAVEDGKTGPTEPRSTGLTDAEGQTAEGKLTLFVDIDRTARFAVAQRVASVDRRTAWAFLQHRREAFGGRSVPRTARRPASPYQVRTVLTDDGIPFADRPQNRNTLYSRPLRVDRICAGAPVSAMGPRTGASGSAHRLTRPNPPWRHEDRPSVRGTACPRGGQVERTRRTIKDGEADQGAVRWIGTPLTIKRVHHDSHDQSRTHLADFPAASNVVRRLKTPIGLTPRDHICKIRTPEPDRAV